MIKPPAHRPRLALALALLFAVPPLAALARGKARGPNPHQPGSDCSLCHTAPAAQLNANKTRAASLLKPNLDASCASCHGNPGPSHPDNVKPKGAVPPSLPLHNGLVTCATCHFMHGENGSSGEMLRIDNRRGKLCLSCHTMSDLEK